MEEEMWKYEENGTENGKEKRKELEMEVEWRENLVLL